jgi:hypothetical protein
MFGILHCDVVKKPSVDHTLGGSDRASVEKLPPRSVRWTQRAGGTYGGRRQSRWRCCLTWPAALLSVKSCAARSLNSPPLVNVKNPKAPAVKREAAQDWGR